VVLRTEHICTAVKAPALASARELGAGCDLLRGPRGDFGRNLRAIVERIAVQLLTVEIERGILSLVASGLFHRIFRYGVRTRTMDFG
jgi:hypothetical protein